MRNTRIEGGQLRRRGDDAGGSARPPWGVELRGSHTKGPVGRGEEERVGWGSGRGVGDALERDGAEYGGKGEAGGDRKWSRGRWWGRKDGRSGMRRRREGVILGRGGEKSREGVG